MAVLSVVGD